MERRAFIKLTGALLAATGLAGVWQAQAQEAPERGGTIRAAVVAQPATLDPHMGTAAATGTVMRNVYEQLLTLNQDFQYVPMLAESVVSSADGMSFTFALRKGVQFHNGKEMRAEDVVASLTRWIGLSSKASMFEGHILTASDDHTVTLTMGKKAYGVLEAIGDSLQASAIMPKEVIENAGPSGVTEFIGTGPYVFLEWKQDQFVTLGRFDNYTSVEAEASGLGGQKKAYADQVRYHFVPDSATRLTGIMTGEYDYVEDLPVDYYDQISSDPAIKTIMTVGTLMLIFNKKEGPSSSLALRRAVAAAVDAEEMMIAAKSRDEFFRLNSSYMYKEQADWYSERGGESYNQNNPEKAKALLAEAGYKGEPVRIMTSRAFDWIYNPCVVLHQQLIAAGINAELLVYDWPTLLERRAQPGEWDIFLTGIPLALSPTQIPYLSANWPGWTDDAKISSYIADINAAATLEGAVAIWGDLQEYCWEYLPIVKIGDRLTCAAYSSKLAGVTDVQGPIFFNAGFVG